MVKTSMMILKYSELQTNQKQQQRHFYLQQNMSLYIKDF